MKLITKKEWLQDRISVYGNQSNQDFFKGFRFDYQHSKIDINLKTGIVIEDDCKPYKLQKKFLNELIMN